MGFLESFVKNVFCDVVKPRPGSVVKVDLLGGAVGDALGAPIEFMSKSAIMQKYGKDGVQNYVEFSDGTGAITDDTQMALFTAEGILRAYVRGSEKGICSPASVVKFAYQR